MLAKNRRRGVGERKGVERSGDWERDGEGEILGTAGDGFVRRSDGFMFVLFLLLVPLFLRAVDVAGAEIRSRERRRRWRVQRRGSVALILVFM